MGRRAISLLAATLAVLLVNGTAFAGPDAPAERPRAVVELFTSQGCTACPPADALFSRLAERDDVVALAYHVDYWDYLGWRDTLATPENTQRQQAYSRAFGKRSVYTPQMVINGSRHVGGNKTRMVERSIGEMAAKGGLPVGIEASYTADSLVIKAAGAAAAGPRKAHLVLAFFEPERRQTIEGGKNHGRTFVYRNSVTAMQSVAVWHGKPATYEVPTAEMARKPGTGCAILLQEVSADGDPGAVLGAAVLAMPSI